MNYRYNGLIRWIGKRQHFHTWNAFYKESDGKEFDGTKGLSPFQKNQGNLIDNLDDEEFQKVFMEGMEQVEGFLEKKQVPEWYSGSLEDFEKDMEEMTNQLPEGAFDDIIKTLGKEFEPMAFQSSRVEADLDKPLTKKRVQLEKNKLLQNPKFQRYLELEQETKDNWGRVTDEKGFPLFKKLKRAAHIPDSFDPTLTIDMLEQGIVMESNPVGKPPTKAQLEKMTPQEFKEFDLKAMKARTDNAVLHIPLPRKPGQKEGQYLHVKPSKFLEASKKIDWDSINTSEQLENALEKFKVDSADRKKREQAETLYQLQQEFDFYTGDSERSGDLKPSQVGLGAKKITWSYIGAVTLAFSMASFFVLGQLAPGFYRMVAKPFYDKIGGIFQGETEYVEPNTKEE